MFWLRVPAQLKPLVSVVQVPRGVPSKTLFGPSWLKSSTGRVGGVYFVQSPSGGGTTSWFDVQTA